MNALGGIVLIAPNFFSSKSHLFSIGQIEQLYPLGLQISLPNLIRFVWKGCAVLAGKIKLISRNVLSGDLVLTNPDNPLESDINIIANPKGKKPQVIDQLSGGEKTLTALAILFSLYLLKPAPFCILDEVDAPLDDANIGKFNDAIKQFSKDSQFILVTHNKTTMTAVDILYGVSQQEEGVSILVPVDFSKLN